MSEDKDVRIKLSPFAEQLVRAEAGDEKPGQKHLDLLLERLLSEAERPQPQARDIPAVPARDLENIYTILVRLQSICLGGFYAQAGEAQEALKELARHNIGSVRKAVEEANLNRDAIDKEIDHSFRELHKMSPELDARERDTGDRERD